ncbi:MAG: HipA N-terminal domain-containing protein [Chitinophagales bacterium]|jgi:HipA-like protein|nr:HipA N-terminal domain-containing protein [Sphingobacteriales bacterium]MBP6664258.1 HipA N-terminal domain-containing protein [Chitinophagales bacterium]MBP7535282.1 HipA N-terminal domain-containing protein [Chitinophagales bacterium]
MSNKILSSFKWLFKSDDQTEEIQTPQNDNAVFQLTFKNLVIGTLSLEKNIWKFAYTDEFKKQNYLKPIVDFPDITVPYQSDKLFPYFAFRIPSLTRLKVQEIIKHNESYNEVELLKRFGKQSIVNPFQLIAY